MIKNTPFLTLSAAFIVGLSAPAAQAQVTQEQAVQQTVSVSLYVAHAPISSVLRTLFQEANIHNYVMDTEAGGRINADFRDVPFVLALRQVLSAATPPLRAQLEAGTYHITARLAVSSESTGPTNFYKIGIKHYDAGMLAHLMVQRDGLIEVPPNFVVTANSASTHAPSASLPATSGTLPGAALSSPDSRDVGLHPVYNTSETVLPDGVKRIFALQSDNSLVIEATPKGIGELTDLQLAAEGYDLVP